jgi:hypothetical protein
MRQAGDGQEAENIEQLLVSASSEQQMKPSRIVASKTAIAGETLTNRVIVPVDKETGAPLAEIHFPSGEPPLPPVLPEQLQRSIDGLLKEWNHIEELAAVGAAPARTCMLFGKPGTGKTRLAHYFGQELGIPVVLARLDVLISSFLGTTARNLGLLFDFANRYKCLLLLDEFDALAKVRDDPQEIGEIKRVVNTLLQNIDDRAQRGLTVAITNHESLLDPAVWRRFEIRVEMPLPSEEERKRILAMYIPPMEIGDSIMSFLSWVAEGLTGSEIETMVRGLKRHVTLTKGQEFVYIDALRSFATMTATSQKRPRLDLLTQSSQDLARIVYSDLRLSQQELGFLLGKDQATISRWLKQ